jgi:hypothetical protein
MANLRVRLLAAATVNGKRSYHKPAMRSTGWPDPAAVLVKSRKVRIDASQLQAYYVTWLEGKKQHRVPGWGHLNLLGRGSIRLVQRQAISREAHRIREHCCAKSGSSEVKGKRRSSHRRHATGSGHRCGFLGAEQFDGQSAKSSCFANWHS